VSLQSYLPDARHAQAVYLRWRAALARTAEHLRGRSEVPAEEWNTVLDAIEDAHAERAGQLTNRPAR
jgi:hypothetical protein